LPAEPPFCPGRRFVQAHLYKFFGKISDDTDHSHSLNARSTTEAHSSFTTIRFYSVSAPRYGLALPPETMLRENREAREEEDLSLRNSAAAPGHCQGRTQTQLNAYSQPT
jgi:hypothetical protein